MLAISSIIPKIAILFAQMFTQSSTEPSESQRSALALCWAVLARQDSQNQSLARERVRSQSGHAHGQPDTNVDSNT